MKKPEKLLVAVKMIDLMDWLADHPGASGSALQQGVGGRPWLVRLALHELIADGQVATRADAKGTTRYCLTPNDPHPEEKA